MASPAPAAQWPHAEPRTTTRGSQRARRESWGAVSVPAHGSHRMHVHASGDSGSWVSSEMLDKRLSSWTVVDNNSS